MRHLTLATLAAFLLGASAYPSESDLRFAHLDAEDGLSRNWVHCTLRDRRGFLWIGTHNGLNRYDGKRFKMYHDSPEDAYSLPASEILSLYEDSRGRLWVGTVKGLALYDWQQDRFVALPFGSDSDQLKNGRVSSIFEDSHGDLWVGTNDAVTRVRFDQGVLTARRHSIVSKDVRERPVTGIVEDRGGQLWVGSETGLHRFDPHSGSIAAWAGSEDRDSILARASIQGLLLADDGKIWVATLMGLFHFDPEKEIWDRHLPRADDPTSLSHSRILSVAQDARGWIWVGTDRGLSVLDPGTGRFSRYAPDVHDDTTLNSPSIWSIEIDDQGIVWLGTYNGGVNYVTPNSNNFDLVAPRRDGLNNPHIKAVLEDARGDLWIATDGGGVNRVDARSGRYTHYRHDPKDPTSIGSDAICALLEAEDGSIWLGGWEASLSRPDPSSGRVRRFSVDQRPSAREGGWGLLGLRSGELLVATQGGFEIFDPKTETFAHLSDRYPGVHQKLAHTAIEDAAGNIWLGFRNFGAQYIDRSSGVVRSYSDALDGSYSLGQGWVMDILSDSRGNVWFGTEVGLVGIVAGTNEVRRYTTEDGLPDDAVAGILEDASGNLWLGTHNGLSLLVDGTRVPEEPRFVNFDLHDGLQGSEFGEGTTFRSTSGRLYFGGHGGVTSFLPDRVTLNPEPPPIVFTDLRVFDKSVRPGEAGSPLDVALSETREFRLSREDSVVTFEFAALNYVLPQKNRYHYRLEGLERDWNDAGTERRATYMKLPPGDYRLQVRASNNDGVWTEDAAELRIVVEPAYWQTWWFRSGAGLGFSFLLWGGYLLRTRSIRSTNAALQVEVDERRRVEQMLEETNSELETSNAELERLARHDPLTGLSNRRDIIEVVRREIIRSERSQRPFALLLGDIDNFKVFNDTHGHACGDAVLVGVASKLVAVVRRQDAVARWGGEEFMILFPETEAQESIQLSERVRAEIAGARFEHDGVGLRVTITVGVTMYRLGEPFDTTAKRVDRALYEGKVRGRDRVVHVD